MQHPLDHTEPAVRNWIHRGVIDAPSPSLLDPGSSTSGVLLFAPAHLGPQALMGSRAVDAAIRERFASAAPSTRPTTWAERHHEAPPQSAPDRTRQTSTGDLLLARSRVKSRFASRRKPGTRSAERSQTT